MPPWPVPFGAKAQANACESASGEWARLAADWPDGWSCQRGLSYLRADVFARASRRSSGWPSQPPR